MAAGAAAVLFWSAPVWWVPYKNTSDLHLNVSQLIAGNSFFFAMVIFLAGAPALVAWRRFTRLPWRSAPLRVRPDACTAAGIDGV